MKEKILLIARHLSMFNAHQKRLNKPLDEMYIKSKFEDFTIELYLTLKNLIDEDRFQMASFLINELQIRTDGMLIDELRKCTNLLIIDLFVSNRLPFYKELCYKENMIIQNNFDKNVDIYQKFLESVQVGINKRL